MVITSSAPGPVQNVFHDPLRGAHQLTVVVALGVGEVSNGQAVPVLFVGEGDPVARQRQELHSAPRHDQCT